MSFLSIIFMLTCYPIIFLMYFIFRGLGDKNGYCFGATLSKELKLDPAIKAIDTEYRKQLKRDFIIMGIIPFVALFVPYISIEFTIWMVWLCVICFYPMVLCAKTNKKVQELKKERGWNQVSEVAYTDLKIAAIPRKVKFLTFLPAIVLSILPVILSYILFQDAGYSAFRLCMIMFAALTPLFYLFAVMTDKQKITVICDDSDTNMNFARAKKQIWKNFWLACIWLNTIFIWFILAGMYFRNTLMSVILWGSVIYCIVTVFAALWLIKKIHEVNRKYESKKTLINAADNDRYWYYGMMYYNPNDSHIMVENRMGTGTAMNMATGIGKGMYIFAILCMLILPISCIWMIMLDFTPMNTEVIDDTIVCTHLSVEYEIPLEDIQEYKVITDMPDVTKVAGTGMDNICSGTFEIYREGMFEAFYNPQNDLFIKIVTEDETYYISGFVDGDTQKIIEDIEAYTR